MAISATLLLSTIFELRFALCAATWRKDLYDVFKICTHIQSERKSRCKNDSTKFQNIIQPFVMRRDAEGNEHIKCICKCWVRNNHNLYQDSCNWQFYFAIQASIRCNQDVNCFRIVMSYFNIFQIIFSWLICCSFFFLFAFIRVVRYDIVFGRFIRIIITCHLLKY